MEKLKELTLLPQEQLDLAYSHEALELGRYRWLALRFLPIDPPVSRLMSAIALECVHRLCSLEDAAKRIELGACVSEHPSREPHPFFSKYKQHFFVVDEPMGRQLLDLAAEAAKETYTFFGWLLETNATPELHQPFFSILTQKQNEYRVLQECRQQWKTGFSEACLAI